MKFDTPATTNPIDQMKVVGRPLDRIEGPLRVTGRARYAYERHAIGVHMSDYPIMLDRLLDRMPEAACATISDRGERP